MKKEEDVITRGCVGRTGRDDNRIRCDDNMRGCVIHLTELKVRSWDVERVCWMAVS